MSTTSNGTAPKVANQDGEKRPLHCYLTIDAHTRWHTTSGRQRISASAMVEALAPHLADLLAEHPEIVDEAGQIEYLRRRRNQ